MRLDAYIRVSRVGGREGESFISPDQQRDKIREWAKLRGVRIAKLHEPDLDQSGGKLSRPNFDKALARVRAGKTDGIVVAKLDRFSRAGVADALKLIESITGAGGKVASVEEGIDPTTPFGEFAMTVLLALARMQRRQIADTWLDAQRRAVERGVHIASKTPTGYRTTIAYYNKRGEPVQGPLEPHPEHAQHVTEIFRMKATGKSWSELAKYLRKHHVASPYDSTYWEPASVKSIIENRAYLGEARGGGIVKKGAHPTLTDVETWEAAQQPREQPVNGGGGALLAGVLRCAGCSYVMKADRMTDRDGTKLRLYRCRGERTGGKCPAPASVLGRVIEPLVVSEFFAGVGGMRAEASAATEELRSAEAAFDRAERELAKWRDFESAVERDDWLKGYRKRRADLDAAADDLDRARSKAGVGDLPPAVELEAAWPDMTLGDQNHLLRAGLGAVFVRTGRGLPIERRSRIYWTGEEPDGLPGPGKRVGIRSEVWD